MRRPGSCASAGSSPCRCSDLTPAQVVERYKSLADIERGFRALKSEIEIGPIYHRLPGRIRAHAAICFMALILYRIMRMRLKVANLALSPERALEQLRRIQHHRIRLDTEHLVSGISTINSTQQEILTALQIKNRSHLDNWLACSGAFLKRLYENQIVRA